MNFYYSMTEHPLNMTNLWFGNYFRILHFSTDFNSCMSVEQDHNENSTKNRCNNCGVAEDSWESLGLQGDQTNLKRKSVLNIHWKDWCWSWSSNTLATWCEELTHWKWPWRWEIEGRRKRDDRGWDGWMASPTRWTWDWASSGRWWWTGRPGVMQSMGSQRVRHDWTIECNLTEPGTLN